VDVALARIVCAMLASAAGIVDVMERASGTIASLGDAVGLFATTVAQSLLNALRHRRGVISVGFDFHW
jgi:hypothetical protein